MIITHHFYGPSTRREHTGRCPTCGKRVKRTRTFEQTVSPFNVKTIDGERIPKTWDEVREAVNTEADNWVPDFEHNTCRQLRETPGQH